MNQISLRKVILTLVGLSCVIGFLFFLSYSRSKTIGDIHAFEDISTLEVTIFFDWGTKAFSVDNGEHLSQIIKTIKDIHVTPITHADENLDSTYFNNYAILINTKTSNSDNAILIRILDDTNMMINNQAYRITEDEALDQIFIQTILSQEQTESNQYYFELLDELTK